MSKPHKIKIGLLGLGTVGSGVYKLIEKQKEHRSTSHQLFPKRQEQMLRL